MPPSHTMQRLPPVLKQFIVQSMAWLLLCLFVELFCKWVLHWHFPYTYPGVPTQWRFGDFRYYIDKFAFFHTRAFFSNGGILAYPAPAAAVYKLFLFPQPKQSSIPTKCFLATILVTSWVMLACLRRALIRRGLSPRTTTLFLLATYLCSFGFWFEVHQANIEFVVWIMVTAGIWAFWRARPSLAAVLFGIAGAMKLFPLIFLGLFLARRQYRQMALALLVAGAATLLSLWLLCPDVAYSWRQTSAAMATLRPYLVREPAIVSGFDHSLFVLGKFPLPLQPTPHQVTVILDSYIAMVALAGCAVYFLRIRQLPIINQIVCLSLAAILCPPVSYEYTLIHLYAPFALMVFLALQRPAGLDRVLMVVFSLFAFILSPQSEFIYHQVRLAGQFRAAALLAIFLITLKYPFRLDASDREEISRPLSATS